MKKFDLISLACIAAISLFVAFFNLGNPGLENWDEGYYAQMSSEFLKNPDIILSYQGSRWYGKPPLGIWLQSAGIILFGENNFGIRAVSSIFFVLTSLLVFLFARKMASAKISLLISLLYVFSPLFYHTHMSRSGDLEQTFIFFNTFSFYIYFVALKKSRYFWVSGISCGLAFLVRGYIAAPALIAILVHALIFAGWRSFAVICWSFLATIIPWHLFAFLSDQAAFIDFYLKYNTFSRISRSLAGISHTPKYYIDFLKWKLGLTFIVIFLTAFSWAAMKISIKRSSEEALLLSWILVYAIALYFTKTIYFWYLIGIVPAIYLILGPLFQDALKNTSKKIIIKSAGAFFAVFFIFQIMNVWKYLNKPSGVRPIDYVEKYLKNNSKLEVSFIIYDNNFEDGPAISYQWSYRDHLNYFVADSRSIENAIKNREPALIFTRLGNERERVRQIVGNDLWKEEIFTPYVNKQGNGPRIVVFYKND